MKNNKGFTLVEILAVLVLISLMMVIIVPNVQKVAYQSKVKLCKSKINLAEESINLWARDNYKCFEKTDGCNILSNCQKNNYTIECESTFKTLAENNLLNYDKNIKNTNYVINPINNGNMNDTIINIKYNKVTKQATSSLSEMDKLKICSKDADEITPAVIEKITDPSDDNNNSKAAEFLEKLYNNDASSNGLEKDKTKDENLRYVGANPKNYVEFANTGELWRIIGVFNVKDSTGKIERKIKLVRNEPLGSYSWDATGNDNYGINNWIEADLKNELNGDYLNTALTANKTNWYNSHWDSSTNKPVLRQTGEFNYTNVIKSNYQNMISESVWNIGGNSYTDSAPYTLNLLSQYNRERGTITYQNSRPIEWTGKVGLIYASDYGYASTLAECHENLRAGVTYENNSWDYSNGKCKTDNWLAKSSYYWTLSPCSGSSTSAFGVDMDGAVTDYDAYISTNVFPAVFLKSDILIASGTGEKDSPYRLG